MSWRKWISIVLACLGFGGIVHFGNDLLIIIAYIVTLAITVTLHEVYRDKISKIEGDLIHAKNTIYSYIAPFLPPVGRRIFEKLIEIQELLAKGRLKEAEGKKEEVKKLVLEVKL